MSSPSVAIQIAGVATLISAVLLVPSSIGRLSNAVTPNSRSTIQDETIVADKSLVAIGETVTFHLEPKPSVDRSPYIYIFDFGDQSKESHAAKDFVRHRYQSPGTFSVSITIETPPGLAPYEAYPPNSISIEVRQVQISASPLEVEVGIPVTFTATTVSNEPNLLYRFSFDDNQDTPPIWQESNTVVHAFSRSGQHRAKVEVGFGQRGGVVVVDSNTSPVVNVTPPELSTLVFHVDPTVVNAGEQVTLLAEFPSNDRHIQYRFIFDDGTSSEWQDDANATHTYREPRTYEPYVEVRVLLDGSPSPLLTSSRETVNVAAAQTQLPSPTRNKPGPGRPETDWNKYLIPILIGLIALVALVFLTAGIVGTYKAAKWAFAPRPTFVPYIDHGKSELVQGNAMPSIQWELHLEPNMGAGVYDIITTEQSLISLERSQA